LPSLSLNRLELQFDLKDDDKIISPPLLMKLVNGDSELLE
ncbi:2879_t:CDS:1, partial [Dentiscutata heterogama]